LSARGYTKGMKTAVSIPDGVFEDAEQLAKRLNTSRSELYARALAQFIGEHAPDRVTDALNAVADAAAAGSDEFVQAAARRTLERSEW
jgi:predicted transcriptional regulator